jgi:hypothetical protein
LNRIAINHDQWPSSVEGVMADRKALQRIGMMFGSTTLAVMLIAAAVVSAHVGGRISLDPRPVVASLSISAQ